jgi:hypothetical protein
MKEEFIKAVGPYIIDAIGLLIVAVVGLLTTQASAWIKAHTKSVRVATLTDQVVHAVNTAVDSVEQSTAKAAKAKTADGKLTPDAAEYVKDVALDAIKDLLGEKTIAEIAALKGLRTADDLFNFLSLYIDAAVLKLPRSTPVKMLTPSISVVPTTPIKA